MIQYAKVPNISEYISHFQDVSEKLGHCSDQLCGVSNELIHFICGRNSINTPVYLFMYVCVRETSTIIIIIQILSEYS